MDRILGRGRHASGDSVDGKQFDFKNESGIGWNGPWVTVAAIGKFGWNGEFDLVSGFHLGDALVPPSDDLTGAEDEAERLIAINRAIKLPAIGEPPGVMDGDGVALFRRGTAAGNDFFYFQFL